MTQLFGHRWDDQEGGIRDEANRYTPRFLLWCRKTDGLDDADWHRGFAEVEARVRDAGRCGKKIFPPSYGEFLGHCERPDKPPEHKPLFPHGLRLEDKAAVEARKAYGRKQCEKLLAMFDDDEEPGAA